MTDQQAAENWREAQAVGLDDEQDPQECDFCPHPYHGLEACQHDRTTHAEGIEIDGPCGCMGKERR